MGERKGQRKQNSGNSLVTCGGASLGERGRGSRAVEVDDLPLPVAAVPHAGLLRLGGAWRPVGVDVLRHPDVGDARRLVAHQVDVGVQDGGVHRFTVLGPHWGGGFKPEVKGLNPPPPPFPFPFPFPKEVAQVLTVFKIKAVKVEAFHQVPQSLRLERRHGRVAHFPAGGGGGGRLSK